MLEMKIVLCSLGLTLYAHDFDISKTVVSNRNICNNIRSKNLDSLLTTGLRIFLEVSQQTYVTHTIPFSFQDENKQTQAGNEQTQVEMSEKYRKLNSTE